MPAGLQAAPHLWENCVHHWCLNCVKLVSVHEGQAKSESDAWDAHGPACSGSFVPRHWSVVDAGGIFCSWRDFLQIGLWCLDPLGVGHMPRVLWDLEQSQCSILLEIVSCPEGRAARSSPMLDTADSMRGVPSGSKMQKRMQHKHLESSSLLPVVQSSPSHDCPSLSRPDAMS